MNLCHLWVKNAFFTQIQLESATSFKGHTPQATKWVVKGAFDLKSTDVQLSLKKIIRQSSLENFLKKIKISQFF
jgi:hypothetical protein